MKRIKQALAAGVLFSMPLMAQEDPLHLDSYGCRVEEAGRYHCYRGNLAGKDFSNQADMLTILPPDAIPPAGNGANDEDINNTPAAPAIGVPGPAGANSNTTSGRVIEPYNPGPAPLAPSSP